jgi:4-amino-4-deoxy-L-arabinose transferase-like glycosyltransferase
LPWYIAVQIETPQFFRVFILEHNLARFGTNLYRHRQPFWYYVPVLLLSLLPWTAYVLAAIVAGLRRTTDDSNDVPGFRTLLLLWIAVPLVFFSCSGSKLPGYLLPAVPACGLLLADWIGRRIRSVEGPSLILTLAHSALGGLLLPLALIAPYKIAKVDVPGRAIMIAAIAGGVIFGAILLTLRSQGLRMARFVTLVPVVIALALVLRGSAPVIDRIQSARPVAAELVALGTQTATLAVFEAPRELEYGLTFYRNQSVGRYERGEIPPGDHLVIAREGLQAKVEQRVAPRRVSRVGGFPAQRLDFFWISPPAHQHMH